MAKRTFYMAAAAAAVLGALPWAASFSHSTMAFTDLRPSAAGGARWNVSSHAPVATARGSGNAYGWRYTNLEQTFGNDVAISGVSYRNGKLEVTIRRDTVAKDGVRMVISYRHAEYHPATNAWSGVSKPFTDNGSGIMSGTGSPWGDAQGYKGPIHLVWPGGFPDKFQTQSVRIVKNGKEVAKWPKAVLLYGSAANPQTYAPGALDSEVLGTSGKWLWVALKGPHYPPGYPHTSPLLWGFRYWNRVAALNLQTGQYHVFVIPRNLTVYESQPWMNPPSMAKAGGRVYVAAGSWIGVFPSQPNQFKPNDSNRVLIAPPRDWVLAQQRLAESSLTQLKWQEINALAAFWNSVMGKHVPGMPMYKEDAHTVSWNEDPVIFNHGVLPTKLVWAMEFPMNSGSNAAKQRDAEVKTIFDLLRSKLNGYASSPAITSFAQVRHLSHGVPPQPLPGYTIKQGAYWPDNHQN